MVRLAAGLEHGWVYANIGGVTISDPDIYVTVGVMLFNYAKVKTVFHSMAPLKNIYILLTV